MTEKRCTDCKYTKGIGYDFWCGEGHTEYEVFGAETNCPYYEYHDWSKGTPSKTEKRYIKENFYDEYAIKKEDTIIAIVDSGTNARKICNELNALAEENKQLKQDNTGLMHLLKNQSIIVQELNSKLLEHRIKEPIILTKEDLELMGKAVSYYTHGRCVE